MFFHTKGLIGPLMGYGMYEHFQPHYRLIDHLRSQHQFSATVYNYTVKIIFIAPNTQTPGDTKTQWAF